MVTIVKDKKIVCSLIPSKKTNKKQLATHLQLREVERQKKLTNVL